MSRLRVAVLFGGASEEHDVSVKSAMQVAAALDPVRYEPFFVGITKSGVWKLCEAPRPGWERSFCTPAVIPPDRGVHGLLVLDGASSRTIRLDVVFPLVHGTTGEDGALQGLLELAGIPYVGGDIQSSALCMDKALAYTVVGRAGIPTPGFWILEGGAPVPDDLPFPLFAKPARSGSSFGVTRVDAAGELPGAIAAARRFDDKVLLEEAIAGVEVGCAVLGAGDDLTVGEVDHIDLRGGFFRIHQEASPETGSENATITVPAPLPDAQRAEIQRVARAIYRALGCRGLARVDLFLQPDGRILLNEVNTMPGFTSYSRYPRMMAAAGLDLRDVIDRLIALAVGR